MKDKMGLGKITECKSTQGEVLKLKVPFYNHITAIKLG